MVRGKNAEEMLEYLQNVNKKGAESLRKCIKSAISNAFQKGVNVSELIIDEIRVDESVKYKRYFRKARGRAHTKLKRYSTLTVKLK